MKKLIVIAALALASMQTALAQGVGLMGKEDGVGAGGSGGNPNATTTSTFGVTSFGPRFVEEETSVPAAVVKPVTPVAKDETVLINRDELLKAVDAALNANDLEMEIKNKPSTVRLQKFDLSRGILHGRILETNKPIRLMDETKASRLEVAPGR